MVLRPEPSAEGMDMAQNSFEVRVEDLRRTCDLSAMNFERSDELGELRQHLGQERAIDAIRFGLQIASEGYNIFVLGPPGSHRHGLAEEIAAELAVGRPADPDWVYVNNFAAPKEPRAMAFPAGQGKAFQDDMRALIEDLRFAIPAAFESDDYRSQLKAIESGTEQAASELTKELESEAEKEQIGIMQTPTGYVLAPIKNGKVLDEKDFRKLPDEEKERIQEAIRRIGQRMQEQFEQVPRLHKRHREQVRELDRTVISHAVSLLLADLKNKYSALDEVVGYLDEVAADIIDNARSFLQSEQAAGPFAAMGQARSFAQYEVNLIRGTAADGSAPVVYEPNPSYHNILGKIEYRVEMGALVTDFRMLRGGALHRANGGFLILDVRRVLGRPFAWEALKQALLTNEIRIESPEETYGLASTSTLQPEPIPLNIKVLLIGERLLFYLLSIYDPEFSELFKVAADLEDDVKRDADNVAALALVAADRIRQRGLLPFARPALERVIEEMSRTAQDGERLSTHMQSLDDQLDEAQHWARQRKSDLVEREDVDKAIVQGIRRLDRAQTRLLEAIERDLVLIDTEGARVGQVNGLAIVDFGKLRFGHPVRITATTRLGSGEVVDVEREVELGGAIHSKGMLILSSALSARYATDSPLSLRASVVFEQSYGGVEGDSASVAEFCALLSSLSGLPVRQNLAVTGSVNQHGRVQVIGGVNEKIEGYFEVCRKRGLDGTHGVIVPLENVGHLMLRQEVAEAVARGEFHVYGVRYIDEAVSLLTGVEAGERGDDGEFPEGSVNRRVEEQLLAYAEQRKKFAKQEEPNDAGN